MDTLTHALSGALVARATWRNGNTQLTLRQRTQAGFLVAAFPDIDYVLRLVNENLLVYLNYHRGITHSVIALPFWALLLAFILSRLMRTSPDWRSLYLLCCLGLGIHIMGDMITSYGTKIFSPISDIRIWLDTTFIIDPFFTLIIISGLLASYLSVSKRAFAIAGLVLLVGYTSMQYWAHERAVEIGNQAAETNWWRNARVSAIPQPLSPFNWKIIIEHKQHYHTALVRLFGNSPATDTSTGFLTSLNEAYKQTDEAIWRRHDRYGYNRYDARKVKQAWENDTISGFRRFTRFPAVIENSGYSASCYWFRDLRFVLPGREINTFFTYGICPLADDRYELKRAN